MKLVALVALMVCVAVPLGAIHEPIADYYWRPFGEEIPRDALQANDHDCKTAPIYIGQAWFKEGLLPSGLYGSNEVVASAGQKTLRTKQHSSILCTSHPNMYKWVPATSKTLDKLQGECELVKGGIEGDTLLFIGRQVVDGKYQIGKIYKYQSRELVLAIGDQEKKYSSYEILTFNCKKACV